MTVKVGDRIAFIYPSNGGIFNLKKGEVGTVVSLTDPRKCRYDLQGGFRGYVKWDNPEISYNEYEYLGIWYVVLLSHEPPKTSKEKPGYEPPLKRMPTFTGKTTNDYM